MEELNEIKLKDLADLTDDEKKVLKENQESLSDEEKGLYKDFLSDEPDKTDQEETEEEGMNFDTEDQFKQYLDNYYTERQTREETEKAKALEAEKIEKGDYFPKGYTPKDWNEYTKDILSLIRKDREVYTQRQREEMNQINSRLDRETEDLRSIDPSIPAMGTNERMDFDRQIAQTMLNNPDITTVAGAYAQVKGSTQSQAQQKQVDTAKKVGGGAGEAETQEPTKYEKYARRGMDEAEEAALEKFKRLS